MTQIIVGGAVQSTRAWILHHLAGNEFTLSQLYAAMLDNGFAGSRSTVKACLARLLDSDDVRAVRIANARGDRVYAMPDAFDRTDLPLLRVKLAPLGILPTRQYDPIGWIVATSGALQEAA
jgi:hypothetical protein